MKSCRGMFYVRSRNESRVHVSGNIDMPRGGGEGVGRGGEWVVGPAISSQLV
jgi:hypothetical protein